MPLLNIGQFQGQTPRYQYYVGKKKKPDWLAIDFIHSYFKHNILSTEENYANFVLAKIYDNSDNPLEETVGSTMLGNDKFIEKITEKYLKDKKNDRNLPALRELKKIEKIDLVHETAKSLLEDKDIISRKAALYICHHFSGKTLKEIGNHFGISESAVSLASSRFSKQLKKNGKLKKKIELIQNKLNLSNV